MGIREIAAGKVVDGLTGLTVKVNLTEEPATTVAVVLDVVMLKSATVSVTDALLTGPTKFVSPL